MRSKSLGWLVVTKAEAYAINILQMILEKWYFISTLLKFLYQIYCLFPTSYYIVSLSGLCIVCSRRDVGGSKSLVSTANVLNKSCRYLMLLIFFLFFYSTRIFLFVICFEFSLLLQVDEKAQNLLKYCMSQPIFQLPFSFCTFTFRRFTYACPRGKHFQVFMDNLT